MKQKLENHDFSLKDGNAGIMKKSTDNVNKSNQCDYASSHASDLRRHLKTHIAEKRNKCSQCDYISSQSSHLIRHLKTHSGEKLNKCKHCDFRSSQASNLRTHLKIHSGEKSHKCRQCNYASSEASKLRRHLKIHIREEKSNSPSDLLLQAPHGGGFPSFFRVLLIWHLSSLRVRVRISNDLSRNSNEISLS